MPVKGSRDVPRGHRLPTLPPGHDSSPSFAQLPHHPGWQRLQQAGQNQAAKGSKLKSLARRPDDGAHYRQTSLCGRPTAPLEGTNSRETRASPYPDSCPDTEGPSMPGLPSSQRTTEAQLSASPGKVLLMVSGLSPSAHDTALLPSVKEAALWTQAAHSLGDLSPHQQWRHPPTPTTIPQQCQLKGHPELSSAICQFSQVTCTLPGTSFPPSP